MVDDVIHFENSLGEFGFTSTNRFQRTPHHGGTPWPGGGYRLGNSTAGSSTISRRAHDVNRLVADALDIIVDLTTASRSAIQAIGCCSPSSEAASSIARSRL